MSIKKQMEGMSYLGGGGGGGGVGACSPEKHETDTFSEISARNASKTKSNVQKFQHYCHK